MKNTIDLKDILKTAICLSPAERLFIIEALSESLSEPDKNINNFWKLEVEDRYKAFLAGEIKSIPYSEISKKWK